jgi:hypothetical protein
MNIARSFLVDNLDDLESEAKEIRNQISQMNEDNLFGQHSVQGSIFKHFRDEDEESKNQSSSRKKQVKKFNSGKSVKLIKKLEFENQQSHFRHRHDKAQSEKRSMSSNSSSVD